MRSILFLCGLVTLQGSVFAEQLPDLLARLADLESRQEKLEQSMNEGNLPAREDGVATPASPASNPDLSVLIKSVRELQEEVQALKAERASKMSSPQKNQGLDLGVQAMADADVGDGDIDSILKNLDEHEEGKPSSEKSLKSNDFEAQYDQGVGLLNKGDCKGAIASFEYCLKNFPDRRNESRLLYQLGCAYKKCKGYKEAKRLFVSVYKTDPKGSFAPRALLQLSWVFINEKDLKKACTTLKGIRDKYPEFVKQEKDDMKEAIQAAQCQGKSDTKTVKAAARAD